MGNKTAIVGHRDCIYSLYRAVTFQRIDFSISNNIDGIHLSDCRNPAISFRATSGDSPLIWAFR